jgi:hypothetical protein
MMTLFDNVLAERITVTRKGRSQAVTKLEVIIRQTIDGALKGEASAKRELFKYLEIRERARAVSQPPVEDVGEHEAELKERFRARERELAEGGGDD